MELLSVGLALGLEILSPAHGYTTAAATIDVVAAIEPAGSSISEATCNGEPAALAHGRIACRISLLPGRNSVVVQTFDEDGSQMSAGISVYRQAPGGLLVGPRDLTIHVGEIVQLRALLGDGRAAPAVWRSSAPDVVAPAPSEAAVAPGSYDITGVAVGTATLSATTDVGVGEVRISVVADPLPFGTITGTAALPTGAALFDTVFTYQTSQEVPELHAVMHDDHRNVTLIGLGTDGQPWSVDQPHVRVPIGDWHAMGEEFGGVVMFDGLRWPTGLVRTAGPADARPWRYRSPGRIDGMAQGHSGTIFLAETAVDGTAAIAVLDGRTGRPMTRVPVRGSDRIDDAHCGIAETKRGTGVAGWTKPIVGDSAGIVVLERHERVSFDGCTAATRDVSETLWLLEVTPDGSPSWLALRAARRSLSSHDASPMFEIGGVLPGGTGMLVLWRLHGDPATPGWQLTRTGESGSATSSLPLTEPDFTNVMLTYDHLVLQSTVEGRVVAIDPASGAVAWTAATSGEFAGISDVADRSAIVIQTADRHVSYVSEGRVVREEVVNGPILPSSRTIMDDRIVLTRPSIADWPFFFGLGRPMPIHQGF